MRRDWLLYGVILEAILLPMLGSWWVRSGLPPQLSILATTAIERPPFDPLIFSLFTAVFMFIAAFFIMPTWFGFKRVEKTPLKVAHGHWPWWIWPGLLLCSSAWAAMWGQAEYLGKLRHYMFVPLWWGFILILDAVLHRINQNTSLITHKPRLLLWAALFSMPGWYYFEYLNFFVLHNWYYPNLHLMPEPFNYVWAFLTFSTVWPALFIWFNILRCIPQLAERYKHGPVIVFSRRLQACIFLLGSVTSLASCIWPDVLFSLIWVGLALSLGAALGLCNVWTPFSDVKQGDWSCVMLGALATLFNGFFWECWNFWSDPSNPNFWRYNIPYVHEFLLFEMPILGYSGYLFFGIECWLMFILFGRLFKFDTEIRVPMNGSKSV